MTSFFAPQRYKIIVNGGFLIVIFFKQKTAYEMESRDWSSDVCSSDLAFGVAAASVLVWLTFRLNTRYGEHGLMRCV